MSLWQKLLSTHDVIKDEYSFEHKIGEDRVLLRAGISDFESQLEVRLDSEGNFVAATLDKMRIIIPVTNNSLGRTSAVTPHPLFEELSYIAKDWSIITNDKTLLRKDKYESYIKQLCNWAEVSKCKQVKLIYKYLSTQNILEDIKNKTNIFNNVNKLDKQKKLLVRFIVGGEQPSEVWKNIKVYNEWFIFYKNYFSNKEVNLSYLNGKEEILQNFFPKYIMRPGDDAKLISSNNGSIVTFGGLVDPENANQVATLGEESMLNATYTLKWLLDNKNHTFSKNGFAVVSWSIQKVNSNEKNILSFLNSFNTDKETIIDTKPNTPIISVYSYGNYPKELDKYANDTERKINILVLFGGVGRISISYYNEIDSFTYYQNIKDWFKRSGVWSFKKSEADKYEYRCPTLDELYDTIYFALKNKNKDKIYLNFLKNMVYYISESARIPYSFVINSFESIKNPIRYRDKNNNFSMELWLKAMSITCSIIYNYNYNTFGGKYMLLDKNETNRSYLFGRFLALAENIENLAMKKDKSKNEERGNEYVLENNNGPKSTNAERLTSRFIQRPAETSKILCEKLIPYYEKLYKKGKGNLVESYKNQIKQVWENMSKEDFSSKKSLDEMFVLGYYGQYNEVEKSNQNTTEKGEI